MDLGAEWKQNLEELLLEIEGLRGVNGLVLNAK
jgi:hypothetical protein